MNYSNIKVILAIVLVAIVAGSVGSYIVIKRGDDALLDTTVSVTSEAVEATTPDKGETEITQSNTTEKTVTKSSDAADGNDYMTAYAYAGFVPVLADTDGNDWNLLLVNRNYILPEDYSVDLAVAAPDSGNDYKLDARVAPHYAEMYNAAKEDGVNLVPLSGFRRISKQKENFENKISYYKELGYSKAQATQLAAQIILPPGTSEHNAGLAMDICSLDVSFENSDEFAWLEENAADYGFILRYAEDKTDITKITYEPWHWRYVGVEAAKAMKASGQCLEEYLNILS